MSNITKEQIQRLEKVGLAIADCIEDEYTKVKDSADSRKELIGDVYRSLGGMMQKIDREVPDNEK